MDLVVVDAINVVFFLQNNCGKFLFFFLIKAFQRCRCINLKVFHTVAARGLNISSLPLLVFYFFMASN